MSTTDKDFKCPYCKKSFSSLEKHKVCKKRDESEGQPSKEVGACGGQTESCEQTIEDKSLKEVPKKTSGGKGQKREKTTKSKKNGDEQGTLDHKQTTADVVSTKPIGTGSSKAAGEGDKKTEKKSKSEDKLAKVGHSGMSQDVVPTDSEASGSMSEITKMPHEHEKGQGKQTKQKKTLYQKDEDQLAKFVKKMFDSGKIIKRRNPQRDVLKFFGKEVKLRRMDMNRASEMFNQLVDNVKAELNKQTQWKWKELRSGSFYDGTKVSRPDEMDCMFIPNIKNLEVHTSIGSKHAPTGFCYVKLPEAQRDLGFVCEGEYLSSTKFRQYIFTCLKSITDAKRNITRDESLSEGCPSFGVNYDTGLTNDDDGSKFIISMDLVPALRFDGWPDAARDFSKEKEERLKTISKYGFHVVAKTYDGDDSGLLWRLSFSKGEQILTKYADSSTIEGEPKDEKCSKKKDKKTYRKKVLRIVKRLLEIVKDTKSDDSLESTLDKESQEVSSALRKAADYVRSKYNKFDKHRFTTFQLRTLLWREFYMEGKTWTKLDRLSLGEVFTKIKKMLTGELQVEHFFIRGLDIMADVSVEERKYLYSMVCVIEDIL